MIRYTNECADRQNDVHMTYLSIGGSNHAPELGMICKSIHTNNTGMVLETFEASETIRDASEYRSLIKSAKSSDLFVINIHGDTSGYKKYDELKVILEENRINTFVMCYMEESMSAARPLFTGSDNEYLRIRSYLQLGGPVNREYLIRYVHSLISKSGTDVPAPVRERAQGIYHPDMDRNITFEDYLKTLDPSKPTVGVLVNQASWLNGNTEPHDLLIRMIEEKEANVLPVFFTPTPGEITGSIGTGGVVDEYFITENGPRVGSVVLAAFGFSQLSLANPTDGSGDAVRNFFQDLNVPVLASVPIFRSQKIWDEDGIGMEGGELAVCIALPELDGQLTTVPFVFNEKDENGTEYNSYREDRIRRIAGMAVGWARVNTVPVKDRKVSIIFNGGTLSNASIGCAGGLDSFASLCNLLRAMKDAGYTVDHIPENSEEVVNELLNALTNNLEWVDEADITIRAADMLDNDTYRKWMEMGPSESMKWVCRNWGEPPGEIMTHESRFIIPGVMNGNVYLGFEPDRGKHAKAEELIHNPDLATPHSYMAYYRWLAKTFCTDINIHMGTHGSVEWLPGKGNGLSEECFPDIMMEDIPNLYAYVIDDPSEGIVAKRRKKSVLVDYLMPSLTRAGTYDDLMNLEGHIQNYLFCKQTRQEAKMIEVGDSIYSLIAELSMWKELGFEPDPPKDKVLEKCEIVFDYISDLKDGLITDGLHIMGNVPSGRHMNEMVYCLTRLKNGRTPSLRMSVSKYRGFDLNYLLDNMSGIDPDTGMINGMLVDRLDEETQTLISKLYEMEFEKDACLKFIKDEYGDDDDIRTVVEYICKTVHPNICGIVEEITNMINGMEGGYVPPGPSGSPTRGNAHLLPTGKNYYSLDPETIPCESSWKVGGRMAEDMIANYIEREGKYPESVGIVVWSIDTMKTGGDDIAYILYLMGVRPIWGSVGGKVNGLEIIPHEELGRPRIDVTVRISSLFRDTFPNVFQLLDEAVEMVADLEEEDDKNFIRKHLNEDMAQMIKDGMSPSEANQLAKIRVFGEPPGTHGAGVNILIESSKWDSIDDLAQIYITCGCSAYGRKWRGEKKPELFKHRLSGLNVAVKNQVDREFDMIDIDDGYSYLGGMNAVVRSCGKEKPVNYVGDSSDPDRIKTRDLEREIAYMMRTRILNPKWIDGLKDHGFIGANLIADNINHAFGWDATSDVIEDWMYKAMSDHFLFNEENRKWIEENNPYALKDMLEDLLEAIDRDLWEADEDTKKRLMDLYMDAEGTLEEMSSNMGSGKE